jgi:hypothetical protein
MASQIGSATREKAGVGWPRTATTGDDAGRGSSRRRTYLHRSVRFASGRFLVRRS